MPMQNRKEIPRIIRSPIVCSILEYYRHEYVLHLARVWKDRIHRLRHQLKNHFVDHGLKSVICSQLTAGGVQSNPQIRIP